MTIPPASAPAIREELKQSEAEGGDYAEKRDTNTSLAEESSAADPKCPAVIENVPADSDDDEEEPQNEVFILQTIFLQLRIIVFNYIRLME